MTIPASEAGQHIVPDSRFSFTEGCVAQVGLTGKKCTSLFQVQSSWACVGDEAAVFCQVAGSVSRQRLVDEGGDLELDALPYCAADRELVRCSSVASALDDWIDWKWRMNSSLML